MNHRAIFLVVACTLLLCFASFTACRPAESYIEKMTPLDAAIEADISPQKVRKLLEDGSNPNQQSSSGYTPLIRASGELRVPREREHLTPEQVARADEVVVLLLAHGANPDLRTKDGSTALMMAVVANRAGAVGALLGRGASAEVETVSGDTPLLLATRHCHLDVLKTLVEHGASIGHRNLSGEDVFAIATDHCPQALNQLPKR